MQQSHPAQSAQQQPNLQSAALTAVLQAVQRHKFQRNPQQPHLLYTFVLHATPTQFAQFHSNLHHHLHRLLTSHQRLLNFMSQQSAISSQRQIHFALHSQQLFFITPRSYKLEMNLPLPAFPLSQRTFEKQWFALL